MRNNKLYIIILLIILIVLTIGGYFLFQNQNSETEEKLTDNNPLDSLQQKAIMATIKTNYGDIKIEFFEKDAPKTVENFIKLSKAGFYNGIKFHRVIKGFMIQGGDPLTVDNSLKDKWGTGGPGYYFEDEIHENNYNIKGTIAMANIGQPNTNGSQFFINTADNSFLNSKHTVFGRVIEGMEIVETIENIETDANDLPIKNVIISLIEITEE